VKRAAAIVAGALALAACAPDSWRRSPAFNDFLWQISRECHPRTIGAIQISTLISDPFFVNETSHLFHQNRSPQEYRSAINAFYPGNNAAALDCILERLPR
jgi:hypothetical protein